MFKGVAGTGKRLHEMWTTTDWNTNLEVGGSCRNNLLHAAWRSGELNIKRVSTVVKGLGGESRVCGHYDNRKAQKKSPVSGHRARRRRPVRRQNKDFFYYYFA